MGVKVDVEKEVDSGHGSGSASGSRSASGRPYVEIPALGSRRKEDLEGAAAAAPCHNKGFAMRPQKFLYRGIRELCSRAPLRGSAKGLR